MKTDDKAVKFERELGKLVCERESLDPNKVAEDWDAESAGIGQVKVTLHIPVIMGVAEFEAMQAKAQQNVEDASW